jgi:two-component system, OmpR family, alkaline phosphatase synthesis response regulator PhoP
MSYKILIIEDEQVINEMYSMKFQKEGFTAESALDWLDWLSKINSFNPDVILLDIMTPWMNWFETLEVIKNQSSYNCKIVMFTNIADKDKIDKAMELWADEYLIKANTTPKDAVERVNLLLNGKESDIKHKSKSDIKYLKQWANSFKIKNSEGGKDIDIEINIK